MVSSEPNTIRRTLRMVANNSNLAHWLLLNGPLPICYKYYFFARIQIRKHRTNYNNNANIDPFKIYRISPNKITTKMVGGDEYGKKQAGRIIGGDWDKNVQYINNYGLYHMLTEHFVEGEPWESTCRYQELVNRTKSGEVVWHSCTNKQDIDERCKSLDKLYEIINHNGVSHPQKIDSASYCDPLPEKSMNRYPINLRAISVNIDRKGAPILDDGRHRTIISKLCNIKKIPVTILVRHHEWQKTRNQWANGNLNLDHFDRPI